ncbi:MAG: radical SAM protein, partial [Kiritimatiellia bacterium]|nr:radical SAM protein [Kiritimatiellia bacterium]
PERPREDINNFPAYPYHLLENFETFLVTTSFAKKALYYLTSEGCTGKCKFCGEESLYHRRWHSLAVDRVIAEIRALQNRYHFDGVAIADSNFYVNQQRVIEFCEKIKPLNLKWGGTSGRPDQLRKYQDSTFAMMKDSGLHDLFLGVESSDNNTLALMAKGTTVEDTIEVIPRLRRHGIRVQCSFIIGVPGVDVRKDLKSTMAFINRLRRTGNVAQFHLFVYTPLPGTGFLADAVRLGYKVPKKLEEWCHYEFHAHTTPWIPKKYAEITDACSIYFMFLAGHTHTIVRSVLPRGTQWMGIIAERMMFLVSLLRVSTCCFAFPIEYRIIKWILLHKDRFFGNKKLMF